MFFQCVRIFFQGVSKLWRELQPLRQTTEYRFLCHLIIICHPWTGVLRPAARSDLVDVLSRNHFWFLATILESDKRVVGIGFSAWNLEINFVFLYLAAVINKDIVLTNLVGVNVSDLPA